MRGSREVQIFCDFPNVQNAGFPRESRTTSQPGEVGRPPPIVATFIVCASWRNVVDFVGRHADEVALTAWTATYSVKRRQALAEELGRDGGVDPAKCVGDGIAPRAARSGRPGRAGRSRRRRPTARRPRAGRTSASHMRRRQEAADAGHEPDRRYARGVPRRRRRATRRRDEPVGAEGRGLEQHEVGCRPPRRRAPTSARRSASTSERWQTPHQTCYPRRACR